MVLVRNRLSGQNIFFSTLKEAEFFIIKESQKIRDVINTYWMDQIRYSDTPMEEIEEMIHKQLTQWELVGSGPVVEVLYGKCKV